MKVAAIQHAVAETVDETLATITSLLEDAARDDAIIAVLPELCTVPYFPQHAADANFFKLAETIPGPLTSRFQDICDGLGLIVVLPMFERSLRGQFFNTLVVIAADGTLVGRSRMMHIPETAECYAKFYFTPGNIPPACFEFDLGVVGTCLGYDHHFPEYPRMLAIEGAEAITLSASITAQEDLDVLRSLWRATAWQNQLYWIVANRVGNESGQTFAGGSCIIGPDGKLLAEAPPDAGNCVVAHECDLDLVNTLRCERPFFRDRRPEYYDLLADPAPELSFLDPEDDLPTDVVGDARL